MLDLIAFDADDTLWHNEIHYTEFTEHFTDLLEPYCSAQEAEAALYETEMRNLPLYGFGTKGFTLSVVETAIRLSDGTISAGELDELITFGQHMLKQDIKLLPHVRETLDILSSSFPLMIITKGDLFDQERKIAESGIAAYFQHIEIVSTKTQETYQRLLEKYIVEPSNFLMTGNSLKSDILPVIALGAKAVHVPYQITWAHEVAHEHDALQKGYLELEHMGQLPALVKAI